MIHKKNIKSRVLTVLAAVLTVVWGCCAQQSTGMWKIYPTIGSDYSQVVEGVGKVYYLSSGSVFSYDKTSNELYFYDSLNKLSGSGIKKIYYNRDGRYLLAVYEDNNMDMVYEDGRHVSLPDIKDASIEGDKTIHDVAFGAGRIVVGTEFGIVVYDDSRHQVIESGNYGQRVRNVAVCGDHIWIYTPYSMMYSPLSSRHNSIDSFKFIHGMFTDRMIAVGDNKVLWIDLNNDQAYITEVDYASGNYQDHATGLKVVKNEDLSLWKDGYCFRSTDGYHLYDSDGNHAGSFDADGVATGAKAAFWQGKGSVWMAGEKGIARMDMSGAAPTVLSDWYKPEGATCREAIYFYTSPDGNRIYAGNLGPTNSRRYMTLGDGVDKRQTTDVIENGRIMDVSLKEASATESFDQDLQQLNGNKAMYGGVTRMAEDPADKTVYWIGNGLEGLYVVKNREEVWKFNTSNAPFETYWCTRVFDVNFDPQGNLWVGHAHNTDGKPPYVMLPAAKLRKGYDKITNDDWVWPKMSDYNAFSKDFVSMFCRKSRYAYFLNADGYDGFYVLDTKGTYDVVKDDVCYNFSMFVDQDGNTANPEYIYCTTEDKNGKVWIGTSQGIFYMNPVAGIDGNSIIYRPKVPRNDGTNYADYLLDSDQINAIAVDHANRKWIATDMSGVYLVSAGGDRIIQHFDTSNSPLPSNRVTAVACDNNDNTVYFGTLSGILSYKGDASPASEDYDGIYAYPNPVRPDYTGLITITGLMDDSLVKIADTTGNVLYQARSEGGMVTWDGCNRSGQRVSSGVYYVYASVGGDNRQSKGAVTKITVIN